MLMTWTRRLVLLSLILFVVTPSIAAQTIILKTTGSSTGNNLDGIWSTPTTVGVAEISGLNITVTALSATPGVVSLNTTSTSLGINATGTSGDDANQFDAGLAESATFRFDQAVSITQLDFVGFGTTDAFSFGGTSITEGELTSSLYDFSSPLDLAADQEFTLEATSGTIEIEAITLTVVPEPSTILLLVLGTLGLLLPAGARRRRG